MIRVKCFLGIIAAALFVFSGCSKRKETVERVFPVRVSVVKPQPIESTLRLAGTIDAKVRAVVASPAEGNMHSIVTVEGRRVQQGQVLGYVVTGDYQNMVGQAEIELSRLRGLWEKAVEGEKGELESQIKISEERLAAAKKLYRPVAMASPIAGTVVAVRAEPGAAVAAKQPIFDVADLSTMIVKTAVPTQYYNNLRVGQRVCVLQVGRCVCDTIGAPRKNLTSCILGRIMPSAKTESRTVDVEVLLPNGLPLVPGEAAEVEIPAESREKALTAPADAVLSRPDGSKVIFLAQGGKARLIKVETGIETNDMIEITSGLKAGDSLIIWGQENLKEGVAIKTPEVQGGKDKQGTGK